MIDRGQPWLNVVERLMDVFELIRFEGFIIKGFDLKINELVALYCYSYFVEFKQDFSTEFYKRKNTLGVVKVFSSMISACLRSSKRC